MIELINALNTLTWPGAIAVAAIAAGVVVVAFAIAKLMNG